jgi:hypothetical protein
MGLVISDSFKAVVTIYILIPFLVIPNIILSGVMVKYEKLNPNLSSPVEIPIYGEIWPARWGYEALAVKQYVDNKYERQFYQLDRDKQMGQYYANFWTPKLIEKIKLLSQNFSVKGSDEFNYNLKLVRNEVNKANILYADSSYSYTSMLTADKVTPEVLNATRLYIERLKKYYRRVSDNADVGIEALNNKLKNKDAAGYKNLKDDYHNAKLEEFVKDQSSGSGSKEYALEFKGKLYQNAWPIFRYPEHKFIKAHFYSPVKQIFGNYVDTFWVNVVVLWTMTMALYLALYFRLFKRVLDGFELIFGSGKGSD